jgi:hypothetical protein
MMERCRFCGEPVPRDDEAQCPSIVAVAVVVGESLRAMLGGES